MGKKKTKTSKILSGVAIPALVVSSIVPVAPLVAHAEESGTYQGQGYTAKWETSGDGIRLFSFNVTLSGDTTITIPAEIEGKRVVSIENKSLENFSKAYFYGKTGTTTTTNFLSTVNMPNLDVVLEFTSNPQAYTSAKYWDGVLYKHTTEDGINWIKQFAGDASTANFEGFKVYTDNTSKPLKVQEFVVPDSVFGPVQQVGTFKGLEIDTVKLPSTIYAFRDPSPFGQSTTFREMDISNLNAVRKAPVMLGELKGTNTRIVLSQSFMNARGTLTNITENSGSTEIFKGTKLDTLEFGKDVTDISTPLFKDSTGRVGKVVLHEGLTKISFKAFFGLKVDTPVVLPSTLTTIGTGAFERAQGLGDIVIPSSVTSIENRAFANIGTRDQLILSKSLTSVGTDAFGGGTTFNKVFILNKYLKYPTNNLPFGLTSTGVIYGYMGSTTESVYNTKGFVPLDDELREPTISSSLINGETYNSVVKPTFTIKYADKVSYLLDGKPYDGVSPILTGGTHTLTVTASNDLVSTTKSYTFSIVANNSPTVIGKIEDRKLKKGELLTIDLKPLFSDPEGDKLTYEVESSDNYGSSVWVNTRGELKFTSNYDDYYEITVRAYDGVTYSEPITFVVNVGASTVDPIDPEKPVDPEKPTDPVDPVDPEKPTTEIPAEGGALTPVTNYKEVINVGLVGTGTEKTIFVDGLLNDFDLDKITPTFKSTNTGVVNAVYNPVDKTIHFESLKAGFSNVQLTIQDDKGNKAALLFMVDVYDKANSSQDYIADGQIKLGAEAYVVELDNVYSTISKGEAVTYNVSVSKDGVQPNVPEEPKNIEGQEVEGNETSEEPTHEEVSTDTQPIDESSVVEDNTEVEPIAFNNQGYMASFSQKFGLASPMVASESGDTKSFVFEVPEGVTSTTLHEDSDLLIRLINGKLVVEGKQAGKYNVSVSAETASNPIPSTVNFALTVLPPDDTGNGGNNGGTDPTDPNGGNEGGNNGGTNPTDPTNPGDGGSTGGNTGGSEGGNTGGNTGGSSGGNNGSDGGSSGGNTGGGSTGGGGNTGGSGSVESGNGGNTGGSTGGSGNTGGSNNSSTENGGSTGGTNSGSDKDKTLEDKIKDIEVEIIEKENGDFIIDIEDGSNVIADNDGTLTLTDKGYTISVGGKDYDFKFDKGSYNFKNKRVVHDINNKKSTAMHYITDNSIVITTSNLENILITSREAIPFKDVVETPGFNIKDIEDLYNNIITTGTTATTYSPKASITRAQFAVMIARALESELETKQSNYTLSDLKGKWYANEVQYLVDLGVITGFTDNTFGGEKTLSRQQAAAMIGRMLEVLEVQLNTTRDIKFADEQRISDYAKQSVHFLAQNDILVNGAEVSFNPHDNLTRNQMAKVLMRALRLTDFY